MRNTGRRAPASLLKPLEQHRWYRQELNLWNEAKGARRMPQPKDFGLGLPDLKPSEVHWRSTS